MNIYEQIDNTLKEVVQGWCSVAKAHLLASAVIITRPATILEIGVWGGRSLIPMAIACREIGVGHVIGVDAWSPDASIQGATGPDLDWWKSVDHEAIYQEFMAHIKRLQLEQWVTIVRNTSDNYTTTEKIGLLHVDGNHYEQAAIDIKHFAPLIPVGGLVFCDDLHWSGGHVEEGVSYLMKIGFIKLIEQDPGALFKRERKG